MISGYAVYVEEMKFDDPSYEALCDVELWGMSMSCSKVLASSYGHILSHWGIVPHKSALDWANASLGGIFYLIMLGSAPLPRALTLFISSLSCAFSLYLAYVLKYVLEDFCIVCVSSYIVNGLIFVFAYKRFTAKKMTKVN
eukprot:CAMPEP_0182545462 /NCGR_PEP_ID=MMETSP1323-20130603/34581_1 /TAXON_ID=236787 /ORGANISM="Florenciella parvula, Strain RCC1693" /LENGTH=140 /DNA_ID=CAMNT_0024756617 /DNA_START=1 /DNA_END=423 /DNA_ORIENTATION=+